MPKGVFTTEASIWQYAKSQNQATTGYQLAQARIQEKTAQLTKSF